jgi:hypothetical protein
MATNQPLQGSSDLRFLSVFQDSSVQPTGGNQASRGCNKGCSFSVSVYHTTCKISNDKSLIPQIPNKAASKHLPHAVNNRYVHRESECPSPLLRYHRRNSTSPNDEYPYIGAVLYSHEDDNNYAIIPLINLVMTSPNLHMKSPS